MWSPVKKETRVHGHKSNVMVIHFYYLPPLAILRQLMVNLLTLYIIIVMGYICTLFCELTWLSGSNLFLSCIKSTDSFQSK